MADSRTEETIFSAALGFAPGEREAYLDEACKEDPALRACIEGLLKAQPHLGQFMEGLPDGVPTGSLETIQLALPEEESAGTRIGRYKLLQKLGEGGCGVVYMAEQEEPVRREVALKVIKLGMDTKSVIARFEAERQALAMMDHPNIAKVLDAGSTEAGRPYFVMELVRGIKITDFCDQNRLSTRERLDLLIQVCQAVQHAHQKGIIHRDLKPSNILVTIHDPGAPGVPKIIDFGIAKATQGRLTDQTLFTAFEQFLGTPAYMSPEQALMTVLDVDTRSDIYSLGVLLYELLTGRTPFDAKELLAAGFEEMRRTIREKEPLRPSARLSTLLAAEQATAARYRQTEGPKLIHLVRGDLDWIAMKCLEKDRARRYETANALAMDLKRHLNNEPVTARPPSRLYEFQKTVRRHKLGFGATAVVMAALALGIVGSLSQASRAGRAEREQRRLTQDAEHHAYISDMNLAHQALLEGDLGRARELLRAHVPKPGSPDPRDWEWRYLASECRGDELFELGGHSEYVTSVRFVDENTLLTTSLDFRTVFHNLQQRRASSVITNENYGGGIGLLAPAFNRGVAYYRPAYGESPFLRTLNLETGVDSEFWVAPGGIAALGLSPSEKILAAASGNNVELWNLATKPTQLQPILAKSQVTAVAFSADNRWLVLGLDDEAGPLLFHDLNTQDEFTPTNIPPNSGSLCFFSSDGRWLGRNGNLMRITILNVETRSVVKTIEDTSWTEDAAFSPDGQWLATVGGDASIRLWDTATWRLRFKLKGHSDRVLKVAFSPSGRLLATGSRNGEVKVWAVAEPPRRSESVDISGSRIVDVARDGSAFWRVTEAQPFVREGRKVVRVTAGEMWSAESMTRLGSLKIDDVLFPVPGLAADVSPGGHTFAVGGFDNIVHFRSVDDKEDIAKDEAGKTLLQWMVISLDGSVLASLSYHGNWGIRAWRLPAMEMLGERKDITNAHRICLSDDGKSLAVMTGTGDIGVLALPSLTGPPLWKAVGEVPNWSACAFSPDGRRLATTLSGDTFIWELSTRRRIALARNLAGYSSLSFSPDGTRLLASDGRTARIFDTTTGQQVFSLSEPDAKVAFTRDGQGLLVVSLQRAFMLHAPPLAQLQFNWLSKSGARSSEVRTASDPDRSQHRNTGNTETPNTGDTAGHP